MSAHNTPSRTVVQELTQNIHPLPKSLSVTDGDKFVSARKVADRIHDLTTTLELTDDVARTASEYYRTACDEEAISGTSHAAAIAACVRLASMHHGTPRPLSTIAFKSGATTKRIRTQLSKYVRIVDIDYRPVQPEAYLSYIGSVLGIDEDSDLLDTARDTLEAQRNVDETFLFGKSPSALTASSVYAALRIHGCRDYTQEEVAHAAHTSAVSIRSHYSELLESYDAVN